MELKRFFKRFCPRKPRLSRRAASRNRARTFAIVLSAKDDDDFAIAVATYQVEIFPSRPDHYWLALCVRGARGEELAARCSTPGSPQISQVQAERASANATASATAFSVSRLKDSP